MKNILVQYSKLRPISLNFVYAEEFLPSPSKSDYDEGVITRYFVRKVNDPAIIEVDLANYESVSSALYSRFGMGKFWPQKQRILRRKNSTIRRGGKEFQIRDRRFQVNEWNRKQTDKFFPVFPKQID